MKHLSLLRFFDIQLFGEGAGAGGGTGAGGDAGGAPAAGQNAAALAQPQTTGAKGNPLAGVQYGKDESAPAAGVQQINTDDRTARFEQLIKGEFKDLYDARVQDTIQKRLKGNEATVQKYNALAPVLDLLAGKYGVKADDVEALSKAIEDDETFYEDEALEKGISVEQVKAMRKMERENAALKAEMERSRTEEQAKAKFAALVQESDQVKGVYPNFDFDAEMQNPAFRQDEIIPAAMQFTAQKVTEKVANSVRAGQRRPAEGAMAGTSAVQRKSDVSQLTKADRREIARRVARGERIVF